MRASSELAVTSRLAVSSENPGKDHVMGGTKLTDTTIPTHGRVASVLDKAGSDPRLATQSLELFEADVADAQHGNSAAGTLNGLHRSAGPPSRFLGETHVQLGRAVQQIYC